MAAISYDELIQALTAEGFPGVSADQAKVLAPTVADALLSYVRGAAPGTGIGKGFARIAGKKAGQISKEQLAAIIENSLGRKVQASPSKVLEALVRHLRGTTEGKGKIAAIEEAMRAFGSDMLRGDQAATAKQMVSEAAQAAETAGGQRAEMMVNAAAQAAGKVVRPAPVTLGQRLMAWYNKPAGEALGMSGAAVAGKGIGGRLLNMFGGKILPGMLALEATGAIAEGLAGRHERKKTQAVENAQLNLLQSQAGSGGRMLEMTQEEAMIDAELERTQKELLMRMAQQVGAGVDSEEVI